MADQARRKANGSQPISRHPLFPAIVALWFGALFGLGSVAISPALVEQVVAATHIDAIVPMAAPPLGTTAQVLVALFMTGLGATVGALVARRIAYVKAKRHDNRSALVGADCLPPPVRVRRVTKSDESPTPATEQHRKAARETSILNVAEFDLESFDAPVAAAIEHAGNTEEPETLDPQPAPKQTNGPVPASESGAAGHPLFDAYSHGIGAYAAAAAEENDRIDVFPVSPAPPPPAGSTAAGRIATAELDSLSQVELLERLALAIARRRDEVARAATNDAPAVLESAQPLEAEVETEPAPPAFADPLGNGLHIPADSHEDVNEAPRVPAALRPVAYREPDEDDVLPGYVPPRHIGIGQGAGGFAAAAPVQLDDSEEDEEDEVLDEGYSSLLDLSRPAGARRQFARFDEDGDEDEDGHGADEAIRPPPISPSQEASHASPLRTPVPISVEQDNATNSGTEKRPLDAPGAQASEETEKALRAALATLQRMSGAA